MMLGIHILKKIKLSKLLEHWLKVNMKKNQIKLTPEQEKEVREFKKQTAKW